MAVFLSPVWQESIFKADGTFAVDYKIWAMIAGSSTPAQTFTTSVGDVANSNPIRLNPRGQVPNQIWIQGGTSLDLILTDNSGNNVTIGTNITIDIQEDIKGVGDNTLTTSQWQSSGLTATYISATSFSLVGDQISDFHVGRALQVLTSGGTVTAKIKTSAFTTLTTVTIESATGNLDVGTTGTTPSLSILSNLPSALPAIIDRRVQNQSATAFTTGGTSTAYTGAPNPAITALADRQSYSVKFSVASGLNPTLAVSGTAPKAIKQYNSAGLLVASTNIPANFISDVQYSLADDYYILCEPVVATASNLTGVTVIASANTIIATTKSPFAADFRSATLSNGVPNSRSLAADASITVPNGVDLAAPPLTTCSSATAAASTTLTLNAAPNQPVQVGQTLFIASVQSAKVIAFGTYAGGLGTGTVILDTAVTVTAAAVVFCHPQRILTGLIDNAGTLEAFVCNQAGGTPLDETGVISTQPIAQTCTFTGAIAVTTGILTLSATGTGTFALGQEITGTAVNQGTVVLSLLTGTLGAAGSTYQTNQFTAAASTAMTGKAGYGVYSTTARTNVPYKITGYYDEVQSAVGVHAVNPILVQGATASAMAALWSIGNGQTYKNKLTERVLALTYYNNTGRTITVSVSVVDGSGGTVFFINGEAVANSGTGASGGNFTITLPIPAGANYLITAGSGITRYRELS